MIDLAATGLVAKDNEVALLRRSEREARVEQLVDLAHRILDDAISEQITSQNRTVAAIAILYSGGNDSTVLAHLFKDRATHAVHANTGIGIEQTRQFVRDTSAAWNLPLIEKHPPSGCSYRELVLDQGFPGPAHHWKMYQRLKERCLEQARNDLVKKPRRERVVFLAGRRRQESARRAEVSVTDRKGSMVFVSPLVLWTAPDMTTYRLMRGDVPRNEVSDLLHMSGECLCGAFAAIGELEQIGTWFPAVRDHIKRLEAAVLASGRHPAWRCRWGWGAEKDLIYKLLKDGMPPDDIAALFTKSKSGPLCTTCEDRASGGTIVVSN